MLQKPRCGTIRLLIRSASGIGEIVAALKSVGIDAICALLSLAASIGSNRIELA